jgi:hypothetical protein
MTHLFEEIDTVSAVSATVELRNRTALLLCSSPMPQHEISPLVLTFLADHVSNLMQFQLLMLVAQAENRWWDANAAGRELGVTPGAARAALDHLAKHNLLDIRITGDVRYQFRPGAEALRTAVAACAEEFRRAPLQVLAVVSGQGPKSIRDFADAFRIRRDDDR